MERGGKNNQRPNSATSGIVAMPNASEISRPKTSWTPKILYSVAARNGTICSSSST